MAATFTIVTNSEDVWGKTRTKAFDMALDASYPNPAGYTITPQAMGLSTIWGVNVIEGSGGTLSAVGANIYVPVSATGTGNWAMHVFITSTGLEVANGVSLATVTIRIRVYGQ